MSLVREVRPGVEWVGAIDWDRRLFDALIPLPDGTSYNSYLVRGSERTALIDAVDPSMVEVLEGNLKAMGIERLDFIVSQHAEQDHSGGIRRLAELYPDALVLASPRGKELLVEFGLVPGERVRELGDGERISLGEKTLEFIHAPWVHWPDTIFTYLPEDRILFTCDFLGSHLATSDLFGEDEARVYEAAKRYYAEIMMPFRVHVKRHLARVEGLRAEVIAPSHGPLHSRPETILDAYRDWSSDQVRNQVVLPYVSMHGSTKAMVDHLVDGLMARGIGVRQFDLTRTDLGELAEALVDAATVVIGSPTVLGGAHPAAAYAAFLASALRPKVRFASLVGSYGWGGRMAEQILEAMAGLKVEVLSPVMAKGYPKKADLEALDHLAEDILSRHRKIGIAGE